MGPAKSPASSPSVNKGRCSIGATPKRYCIPGEAFALTSPRQSSAQLGGVRVGETGTSEPPPKHMAVHVWCRNEVQAGRVRYPERHKATTLERRRLFVIGLRYDGSMVERRVITPEEMDLMSPDERDSAVRSGELRSLDDLPVELRKRVIARAAEIEERLRLTS